MNPSRRRSVLRWPVVAVLVVLALAVGLYGGGHTGWMPNWIRSAFTNQSQQDRQIDNVLGLIQRNYYRPLSAQSLANRSLEGAVASLDDPYSHYFPPQQEQEFDQATKAQMVGIGVTISSVPKGLLINHVLAGGPAAQHGLVQGQIITAVNGRSLAGLGLAAAAARVMGQVDTRVRLTLLSGSRRRTVSLTREEITEPVSFSALLRDHGVKLGYIDLVQFSDNAAAGLKTQLQKMLHDGARGIILDLRGNPGGLVTQAVEAASLFIPHGTIVSTRGRNQPTTVYTALGGAIAPSLPLAVLVNCDTASAAEILTAALQQRRGAQVVGTRTYGKGVFQQEQPVTGGGILDITVGEFFTPDGTNLGGTGVAQGKDLTRGPGIKPNDYVYDNPNDPGSAPVTKAESVLIGELRR